jgi:hypothetical protein
MVPCSLARLTFARYIASEAKVAFTSQNKVTLIIVRDAVRPVSNLSVVRGPAPVDNNRRGNASVAELILLFKIFNRRQDRLLEDDGGGVRRCFGVLRWIFRRIIVFCDVVVKEKVTETETG